MALVAATALAAVILLAAGPAAAQVRDIPDARWEPIYFKSINEFTSRAGWRPLRGQSLGADSIEVRIWIGFGVGPMEVMALRRDGATWSGRYGRGQVERPGPVSVTVAAPKSSWEALWRRLTGLGILTLPDESSLPKSGAGQSAEMTDGVSYVVEISTDGRYRTYMYGNPDHADWPEARRIVEIIGLLRAELMRKT
jgi:hypothetical protein